MAFVAVTEDTLLYVLRWGNEDFAGTGQVPVGFSEVSLNVGETPNVQPDRHNGVTAGAFVTLTAPQQDAADDDYVDQGSSPGVVVGNLPVYVTIDGGLEDSGEAPGDYLTLDGARAMAADLDMGTFAITNVGNVDGVDVSNHVSRHASGGADQLSVAGLSGLLADDQNPTAHAADHILGGNDEIDGDQIDIDFTPTNYTPDTAPAEVTNVDHLSAHLAGIDNELASGGGSLPVLSFKAAKLETPLTADWAVNDFAPLAQDTLNTGTGVLLFDDTMEEGGGMTIDVPATAASMQLFTRARAEGVPAGAVVAKLLFYEREYPDGAAQGDWSSSQPLTDVDLPITTQFFHVDVTNQTLAAWGLVAGSRHQIQITRTATGNTLIGDLALENIRLEFTA